VPRWRLALTFAQVTAVSPGACKTVGLAYVGSNPTPATSWNTSSGALWRPWLVSGPCSQMPPEAAVCRWSWDIRGMA